MGRRELIGAAIAIAVGVAAWRWTRGNQDAPTKEEGPGQSPPEAAIPEQPTFARDVAPLVHRECAPCHHPDGPAPFPLVTYDDVRDHATQIVEVTASGFMPPWLPADKGPRFAGERRLTKVEKEILSRWAERGTELGDASAVPKAPTFTAGWQLGEPDLVLRVPEAFTVPADGRDVYRNFVIRVPPGPTRFVEAVELRPGDPRVVHHAVLRIDRQAGARRLDQADPEPGFDGMVFGGAVMPDGRFIGWTPGKVTEPPDPERAWTLPRDVDLVLQVHLRPTGKEESIRSEIGLHFSERPPTRRSLAMELSSTDIDIPPGEAEYRVEDHYTLPADVRVLSVYPHAHYLGKHLVGYAEFSDGRRVELIDVPRWDFNWQDQYRLVEPLVLPKGSSIHMEYTFDNSADNPFNPSSPPRRVVHGPASTDEMAELILELEPVRPEDLTLLDRDFMRKWLNVQIGTMERELEKAPDQPAKLTTLGALLWRRGSVSDAVAAYRRALDLEPDDAEIHLDLGMVMMQARQQKHPEAPTFDVSLRHLERAVALDPELARAQLALGDLHRLRAAPKLATQHYRTAIALNPGLVEAHNNLGIVLETQDAFEEAAAAFQAAVEIEPQRAVFHENLGRALAAIGRQADAIAAYRAALDRDGSRLKTLQALAWLLATTSDDALRDPAEAARLAELAARLTQNRSPEVLDAVAAAYAGLGRFDVALRAAQTALSQAESVNATDLAAGLRERIALYRDGKPYRARD